ncbi:thiolase family protein [Desulfitobacterium chlororespirans]|uniref:Acetyl-CoA acetyltransferase n=1 Tax=Desulfitobacterium chlororespirans DSM 11544 TaxID=1121395 RepID=A0A1M7SXU4_9FIRM|nr:thiolase family protein [Desulfitobacterium chlororespirans]SHN63292.1 acetyl-CoA acyltransferase [Desulfitobacterium chlororespirans DSM 11544]
MQEVVIVAGARTPIGKGVKGTLKDTRPELLGSTVIKAVLDRAPGLSPGEIEDVIFGCAFPEGEQGLNIGRMIALAAGLPVTVPGFTLNRFCSSGLQAVALASWQIMAGAAEVVIAGGVESMSMVPIGGIKPSPDPELLLKMPAAYISMGETAENVAARYGISREEQDAFAVVSHQKAAKARAEGKFRAEIVPVPVIRPGAAEDGAKEEKILFAEDEGIRPQTTMEDLARLKTPFRADGTVTAGNSSQISDGAAAVILMSAAKARQLNLKPLAIFRSFAVGGVHPDEMGIGPVVAIPKALQKAGLTLGQIDTIELNEAFASQALYCIRKLGLDSAKVNPNGGAIAMGHPLGCTGAKLTVSLIHELERTGGKYGMVSMCVGGGMGAAAVFEKV